MNAKLIVKYALGYVRAKRGHIPASLKSRIYIGKNVKFVGGSIALADGVVVRPYAQLWNSGQKFVVGYGSEIGERCRISIRNSLVIGEKVLLSPNVYVTDCDHAYEEVGIPVMDQGAVRKDNRVVIGDHAYIGINTVIVGNITIGKGSIIGANSVVTRSIPDYSVAVGIPAKVVKKYNFESNRWEKT